MSLTQTELTDENELIEFLVIYNKERFQIQFPIIKTILNLKEHLQTLTCILFFIVSFLSLSLILFFFVI